MSDILFRYERVNPTTWAYLSSLLTLALYFKFGRFWSVRNLDLVLVILLAPGLLCIKYALDKQAVEPEAAGVATVEQFGYIWLFSISGLLLARMLLDSAMVRRPLLEPNLSAGGLGFLTISLLLFLMANVIAGGAEKADLVAAQRAENLVERTASDLELSTLQTHGPGFTLFHFLPHITTQTLLRKGADAPDAGADGGPRPVAVSAASAVTARVMAILSQLMIVLGIVLVAGRHFDSVQTGIAAATLYLMMPYTAMWTGSVTHALPGALLVWAVLWYRRPLVSGLLIGALAGTIYYPIFLAPLWVTFYWQKGVTRFVIGVVVALALLVTTLVFTSTDAAMFFARVQQMFGLSLPRMDGLAGAWRYWHSWYRLPLFVAFVGLSFSFILWPAQKNLGTLLSCSAALMIGTQFWHAHSGGMALAWYLPVLLLTVFRPNLEDRVALEMVPSLGRRRAA